MSKTRIIKKYPNRRLYDTVLSKYITLKNVKELVINNIDFCVKDVKTDEDLTRSILLQIISEQEHDNKEPFFTESVLSQIIRFYNHSMQSVASDFVQKSLSLFVEQQKQLQGEATKKSIESIQEIADNNLKIWHDMQQQFFQVADLGSNKNRSNKPTSENE